ncbi:hypothetical protein KC685_04560 [Candidatus Dojkabacteria bacterium]|uniref:Uncharacterized protein n=1 Tax=Candidatus Dojkabacteria bacterium TaxID=2099670 RepID=A0A955KYE2_9BACT|nr:hypothetical protein [Candidatus Dojkabacteria bacterium]
MIEKPIEQDHTGSDELEFGEYIKVEDSNMSSGMMIAMFIGIAIVIVSAIALAYTYIYNERFPVSLNLNRNLLISREEVMIDNILLEIDTDLATIDPNEDFQDFQDQDLATPATPDEELSETIDEIDELFIDLNEVDRDFNDVYESDLGL